MTIDLAAWLDDSTALRIILVEVDVNISGSETTLYLSSSIFDDPINRYDSIVNGESITIEERIDIGSNSLFSFGDIELLNMGGEIDGWIDYIWVNRRIGVYLGDSSWDRADFITIFDGVVEDIGFKDGNTIGIKLRNKLERLNYPIYETRLGGTTVNSQEIVPLCFGECFNVSPLLIDPATLRYKVHSGPIEDIIEVRDNGVPVSITKYLSVGEFTLSQQPFGKVTASVQGDKPSGVWNTTVSKIIQRIVTSFGGPSKFVSGDLDTTQLNSFNASNTQPVGIYTQDRENTLTICEQIADSIGAQMIMTRSGQLQLKRIEFPPLGTPFEITQADIVDGSLYISEKLEVVASFSVGVCKNYTVQENLETGIPDAHKALFGRDFQSQTSSDSTTATLYKLTTIPKVKESYLLTEADGLNEAIRMKNIFSVPRYQYEMKGTPRLIQLALGDTVRVTHPRYNLDSGVLGVVTGISVNWSDLSVRLEVLA